ncbi:MAG TPA: hypothetical protein VGV59_06870 [Pyrinomonadaceae bacterium]|nr:hypothetical protein [Pyrinomonadaceae bacterium]
MTGDDFREAGGDGSACPRCHARPLRAWEELNEAERTVVERLPASALYTPDERRTRHRWCPRCWHETTGHTTQNA